MISKLTTSSPVISQLRGNCFGIDYASNSFSPMLYNFLANPKKSGGSILTPFVVFFKSTFFRVRVKPCSFFTLILSKVTSFLNVLLKFFKHAEKMKTFFFNVNYFQPFFGFFDISLLQRNWSHPHITDDVSIFYLRPTPKAFLTVV